MKAKDTVTSEEQKLLKEMCSGCDGCSDFPLRIHNLCSNPLEKYLHRSRQKVFKEGIREVVEFIGTEPFEHNYSMYGYQVDDCFACKWQDQLKKWGIE